MNDDFIPEEPRIIPKCKFKINRKLGSMLNPSEATCRKLKMMVKEGKTLTNVCVRLGVDYEIGKQVLEGRVWPYSGGPLRNTKLEVTSVEDIEQRDRVFYRNWLAFVREYLDQENLQAFCDLNVLSMEMILKETAGVKFSEFERFSNYEKHRQSILVER